MPYKNPEDHRESQRRYRESHRGELREKALVYSRDHADVRAVYREENRENCRAYDRARYAENPARYRLKNIERQYRITRAEYDQMFSDQGGCCAICGKTEEDNGKALAVDHDHACCPGSTSCGQCVRSLLCNACNLMIGLSSDNAETLISAASYLMSHKNME